MNGTTWYVLAKENASRRTHIFYSLGLYFASSICNPNTFYRLTRIIEVDPDDYDRCPKCTKIIVEKVEEKLLGRKDQDKYESWSEG